MQESSAKSEKLQVSGTNESSSEPPLFRTDELCDLYVIEKPLRPTAFSQLYVARPRKGGQRVIIKFLCPTPPCDVEVEEARFRREAHLHGQMEVGVPTLITPEPKRERGHLYLVMEYLSGETLAERLRQGPLSKYEALRLGQQIADILTIVHQQAIVHRDIKPDNIFLERDSLGFNVKLLDWGISVIQDPDTSAWLNTQTMGGGQGHYHPIDAKTPSPGSDITSLAAIVIQSLTGQVPSVVAWGQLGHPTQDKEPLTIPAVEDLPMKLRSLLARSIGMDVNNRPGAAEMSEAFKHALIAHAAEQQSPLLPFHRMLHTISKRPRLLLALLLIVLFMALLTIIYRANAPTNTELATPPPRIVPVIHNESE